ncbi:vacuolar protein sorting-associated protein 51 homolog isoform X2 [Panonychus citri]|nr:vacuolar protein sorting-associated protein 51 homolog isoform X2 [Panonychus citri]
MVSESGNVDIGDLFNVNSPDFNADLYLSKLLKECNISQLMDKEDVLRRQIQSLDNEMQTLVYENYNKFINATQTIKKMSNHFDKMEEQLTELSSNMEKITVSSEEISKNLATRRQDLSKLSATDGVLKKLQFLFDLPPKMKKYIEERKYDEAISSYNQAVGTLSRYSHFPSIEAIDHECEQILSKLRQELYNQLQDSDINTQQLAITINLLLGLNESPSQLSSAFLETSKKALTINITELEKETSNFVQQQKSTSEDVQKMDILEYMDLASNGFVSNLSIIITSYKEIFIQKLALNDNVDENHLIDNLKSFVNQLMDSFFSQIKTRLSIEPFNTLEIAFFVRSLDRLYRRLQALSNIFGYQNYTGDAFNIIWDSSSAQCSKALELSKIKFDEELVNARHSIIGLTSHETEDKISLSDIVVSLETSLSESIKNTVKSLSVFSAPDLSFLVKTNFRDDFILDVREKVVASMLKYVISLSTEHQRSNSSATPLLVLLLSRLNLDLDLTMISYLINFTEEQLYISRDMKPYPHLTGLKQSAKDCAQNLINNYVRLEGHSLSQMIKKSIETRDWSSGVEPRSVRSVMKRVVEDVSLIDSQVTQLYEEGSRTERSSDSSRSRNTMSGIGLPSSRSYSRSNWSSYGASTIDNSLISNIQRLFGERIEIFSSVEFSKLSIVTGIIKIGLKTFLESVRLCTFSTFGLQQVQVDLYYLQTHLWRFVTDENLVHSMIDEVLRSTINRCLEPVLMEMSIVEKLCEGQ